MTITPDGPHRLVARITRELYELAQLGNPTHGDPALGICCRRARLQAFVDAATWTLDRADLRDMEAVLREHTETAVVTV